MSNAKNSVTSVPPFRDALGDLREPIDTTFVGVASDFLPVDFVALALELRGLLAGEREREALRPMSHENRWR